MAYLLPYYETLFPSTPLKAGYTTHQRISCWSCRFIPQSAKKSKLRFPYRDGPPRQLGQRLHAFVDRPRVLTPSINPGLGAPSQHKELHRYALWRIFRPAL